MDRTTLSLLATAAVLAAVPLHPALAQSLDYGKTAAEGSAPDSAEGTDDSKDTGYGLGKSGGRSMPGVGRDGHRERLHLAPYIEAMQAVSAELSPGHDVVTWSALAAGVDGRMKGRSSEAAFSVRYERRFGWGDAPNGDTISGLARGGVTIVPGTLSFEAGGLATRTSVDVTGASLPGVFDRQRSTQLYSFYAGPNLSTSVGDASVNAHYRIGYSAMGTSSAISRNGVQSQRDLFDHSVVQDAGVHTGIAPGVALPVGLGAGAGWYREDISNLDQRIDDKHVRLDATLPVSTDLALVGGVGYEHVEVSSRDVLRDGAGLPVIDNDGRYVTDGSAPRQIAYETSGLIWDAGVTWRPSRRTAAEAHVGWRYGGTTVYGSFGWMPNRRTTVSVAVYDSMSGIGGQLNRALVQLPSDFVVQRDPITGDIQGCVVSLDRGACITNALGSARSAVFRSRGIMASYSTQIGGFGTGLAAGYDRRRFVAAPGTILSSANGVIDENTWLSAWFNGRLARRATFGTYAFASWYRAGRVPDGDGLAFGASGNVNYQFDRHLSANAAVSIQALERKLVEDLWNASALLGVRYSF